MSTAQRTRLRELLDESEDGPSTKQVDLGFLRQVSGVYTDAVGPAGPPPSVFALATKNFRAEFDELVRSATEGAPPPSGAVEEAIDALVLSNRNIARRERRRARVAAPWVVKAPYVVLCAFLDAWFEDRPIARFWFLETVARMPYFAYISTLGWWRREAALAGAPRRRGPGDAAPRPPRRRDRAGDRAPSNGPRIAEIRRDRGERRAVSRDRARGRWDFGGFAGFLDVGPPGLGVRHFLRPPGPRLPERVGRASGPGHNGG